MEAVAASFDAVAPIEGRPLLGERLLAGAQTDDPPLLRMMPVYRPTRERRPRRALVQAQNIASTNEGPACDMSGIRPRLRKLCAQPSAQEPRRLDDGKIGDRNGEAIVPVAVARFLHVGTIAVSQNVGDHPTGGVDHSYGESRRRLGKVERPAARVAAVNAIDAPDDAGPRPGSREPQEALHAEQLAECGYQVRIIGCGIVCCNPAMADPRRLPTADGLTMTCFADTP